MTKPFVFCPAVMVGLSPSLFAVSLAWAIDPFFPAYGNKGYDVLHYDLDLTADPAAKSLEGAAKVSIKATRQLKTFQLDLFRLKVASVTLDGDRVRFSQTERKLTIKPKGAIARGRPIEVVIRYGGTPTPIPDPTTPGQGVLPLGWLHLEDSTNALSAPVGASSFFPCNDQPTDRATYSISVTVPKPYTAVANGLHTKTDDLGSSQRFHYTMTQPMTTWLATAQISAYRMMDQDAAGIPVLHYVTKNVTETQIDELMKTPQYMSWLSKLVGPHPFDSYGSVTVDDERLRYALETQALSTFPSSTVEANFIVPSVIVHELAHQWFGNSLAVAEWRDVWIAEGFATYFEFLNQSQAFDDDMVALYDYLRDKKVGPAVVSRPEDLFADNTYYRGAVTLFALRQHVGEPVFWEIIREFYGRYKFKSVTSADFIDVAVEVSHNLSVRKLLNAWLFRKPVPPLPNVPIDRASRVEEGRVLVASHLARRVHAKR